MYALADNALTVNLKGIRCLDILQSTGRNYKLRNQRHTMLITAVYVMHFTAFTDVPDISCYPSEWCL